MKFFYEAICKEVNFIPFNLLSDSFKEMTTLSNVPRSQRVVLSQLVEAPSYYLVGTGSFQSKPEFFLQLLTLKSHAKILALLQ